jgi:hypothetical protein
LGDDPGVESIYVSTGHIRYTRKPSHESGNPYDPDDFGKTDEIWRKMKKQKTDSKKEWWKESKVGK